MQFRVGSEIKAIDSYTTYYFPPMFKMKQNIVLKHLLLEIAPAIQHGWKVSYLFKKNDVKSMKIKDKKRWEWIAASPDNLYHLLGSRV